MGFFKRRTHISDDKQIELFALIKKDDPTNFITITNNLRDIEEHIHKLLLLKHNEHFSSWCQCHDMVPENPKSWEIYFKDCIPEEEMQDYLALPIHYKFKDIVAMLRMFGGCIPLHCSFNTPVEISFFNNEYRLSKNRQKEGSGNDQ